MDMTSLYESFQDFSCIQGRLASSDNRSSICLAIEPVAASERLRGKIGTQPVLMIRSTSHDRIALVSTGFHVPRISIATGNRVVFREYSWLPSQNQFLI